MVMGRFAALAVLVVVLGAVAGCSGAADHTVSGVAARRPASPAPGQMRFSGFRQDGLAFRYPSAWRPQLGDVTGSFVDWITDLSPTRLHNICRVRPDGVTCGGRVLAALPPRGVLVTWLLEGRPGIRPPVHGARTTLGGHQAFVSTHGSAACAGLGAQQVMTAAIHRVRGNWLVMAACLRAPGLAESEAAVWAMLRSVRLY
jgi:hypothetical protein